MMVEERRGWRNRESVMGRRKGNKGEEKRWRWDWSLQDEEGRG